MAQKETRQLVIQRLEQERAEDMATTAAPAGVEDVNTDDEVCGRPRHSSFAPLPSVVS